VAESTARAGAPSSPPHRRLSKGLPRQARPLERLQFRPHGHRFTRGIAIFDHPSNLRHPRSGRLHGVGQRFGYFSPAHALEPAVHAGRRQGNWSSATVSWSTPAPGYRRDDRESRTSFRQFGFAAGTSEIAGTSNPGLWLSPERVVTLAGGSHTCCREYGHDRRELLKAGVVGAATSGVRRGICPER